MYDPFCSNRTKVVIEQIQKKKLFSYNTKETFVVTW